MKILHKLMLERLLKYWKLSKGYNQAIHWRECLTEVYLVISKYFSVS